MDRGTGWAAVCEVAESDALIEQQAHTYDTQVHVVTQSCPTLAAPWTVARQAPLSMGFSRQEDWSGQPFPSPGDLPDPGI